MAEGFIDIRIFPHLCSSSACGNLQAVSVIDYAGVADFLVEYYMSMNGNLDKVIRHKMGRILYEM